MIENIQDLSSCTLHIILATSSQRQEKIFDDEVHHHFFEKYRNEAEKYYEKDGDPYGCLPGHPSVKVLYNPLQYHLFGNYDLAYISLIDNYKFAQQVFEPPLYDEGSSEELLYPHTFQSFTGITHTSEADLKKFFYDCLNPEKPCRPYFLTILNCKLNNGLLIGNGADYLEAVLKAVEKALEALNKGNPASSIKFLLLQTFSWFEISVMIFTDDPNNHPKATRALRRLTFGELENWNSLLEDSLYKHLFPKEETEKFEHINLFSDTHSYIGFHSDLVKLPEDNTWINELYNKKIEFKTTIEWQVKPGHLELLSALLREKLQDEVIDMPVDEFLMLAGKSDYAFARTSNHIKNNLKLIRLLREEPRASNPENPSIYDHIRKVRTRVIFIRQLEKGKTRFIFPLHLKLRALGIPMKDIQNLNIALQSLKVSRPIRTRVMKLFSNFNNGIQDVILFPLFLDFIIFMKELQQHILENVDRGEQDHGLPGKGTAMPVMVSGIEDNLMERIAIFQEGYNIRMLNCYQFEDITDFDLDFNTAVQQLLSAYSTMAMSIGSQIYGKDSGYGPMVQLNLRETVSNYLTINYYTHHLTSPEFVFATIIKEILNMSFYDKKGEGGKEKSDSELIFERYEDIRKRLESEDPYLADMIQNKLINIQYLVNDMIRFVITYNLDFELFYYWFWTYNLQNASLFDKSGMMNEEHFKKELFRILFIAKIFGFEVENSDCPLRELYTYWDRHFRVIRQHVADFITALEEQNVLLMVLRLGSKLMKEELEQVRALGVDEEKYSQKTDKKIKRIRALIDRNSKNLRDSPDALVGPGFIVGYAVRDKIYEQSRKGQQKILKRYSAPFFQWEMHEHLQTIFRENNKTITFLHRNWENGAPLQYYLRSGKRAPLFLVDPVGGLFFETKKASQDYFRLSSSCLYKIWDFSLHIKRDFIRDQLNADV